MTPGGYAWWYLDALADDGAHGLTIIAMIGNVFSPYYALRRRRGPGDPDDHVALNVALYGGVRRWTMTERGRRNLLKERANLVIGPSSVEWDGTALTVRIAEVGAPLPRRVRGTVRLLPSALTGEGFTLDPNGLHRWWPIAPLARVEARFDQPALAWDGHGYLDCNAGDEPLEAGFVDWDWSRAADDHGAVVLYDRRAVAAIGPIGGVPAAIDPVALALRFRPDGGVERLAPPPRVALPAARVWRMARATRSEDGTARVLATLEDTPFYARSLVETRLGGRPVTAVHESLSLARFRLPIVQAMLPFRMPRRA